MNTINNDAKFWSENIVVLFEKEKLAHFFPVKNMDLNQKLNAVVRLSIYISIAMFFKTQNYKVIYIFITALALTFLIHKYTNKDDKQIILKKPFGKKLEKEDKFLTEKVMVEPTVNNPFTNITIDEYEKQPNRESLLDLNDKKMKKDLEDKFSFNLYKDINDVYNTNNSQRQFYTTPITTIPNKQKEFAEWCYKMPPTCKEKNGMQCVANNYTPLDGSSRLPITN